jgi:hypothetical protein
MTAGYFLYAATHPIRAASGQKEETPFTLPKMHDVDLLERPDYIRWNTSEVWQEVIYPAIEREEYACIRQLVLMDPRDEAEVAHWQGMLRMAQAIKLKPAHYMEALARHEETRSERQRREDRGAAQRIISFTRGR